MCEECIGACVRASVSEGKKAGEMREKIKVNQWGKNYPGEIREVDQSTM